MDKIVRYFQVQDGSLPLDIHLIWKKKKEKIHDFCSLQASFLWAKSQ